jgi:ABC-type transport system involved in multi-copper enzyme maturation permease subunit
MNATTRHTYFSVGRVTAIARNTFTELVRLKIFHFLLIFGLGLIGSSAFWLRFTFQEEFQLLRDVSLGAMSVFTSLLAIVSTAHLLPKDVEDRTLYTILAKPVPRFEYLLGKLLGVLLVLAAATLVMAALSWAVLQLRVQWVSATVVKEMAGSDPAQISEALAKVRAAAFTPGLLAGVLVIYAKAALLSALTLFVSTFASSTIFTIVIVVAVYLIGHMQATAREYWLSGAAPSPWARVLLALVSLVFPDLQLFNLVDDLVAGNALPAALFAKTLAMGGVYVAVYLALAGLVFSKKEL